jgi:selenocysteine-specific elongation factor
MELPVGRRVAFVDVPGHEKFVRTMISGATGIDAVLLCVSAQDGVMPQTREHLAILELLGIREGAVVLTKADLVDAELLELAQADVADVIRGTFLENKPILAFSAVTGQGRDDLMAILAGLNPRVRPIEGPFRLPVDRVFVRSGFGTVVTGTVWSGRLKDGEPVTVLPEGLSARGRGIQVHGEASSEARAGWRAALNLAGIEKENLSKGAVVVTGAVPCTSIIDVRYQHLVSASSDLEDDASVRVLHGTTERLGRFHLAEDRDSVAPGGECWAQIRLESPLPCLPGDALILRRPSPQETLGGARIVDPWAPKLRRRDRSQWAGELTRLHGGDTRVWLERAGDEGLSTAEWASRAPGVAGVTLGDRVFGPRVSARLEGALLESVEAFHRESPLSLGANRRELKRGRLAHLSDRVFDGLVERLAATGAIVVRGPLLRAASFGVAMSAAQEALQARVLESISAGGLEGLRPKDLQETHPEPEVPALLHLLENAGNVEQVAGLGWVAAEALRDLTRRVRVWFESHSELSPGDFKELTGLARKPAIPLLEWLDRAKVSRRVGDVRVRA